MARLLGVGAISQLSDLLAPFDRSAPDSAAGRFRRLAERGRPGGWRYVAVAVAAILSAIVTGVALALALTLSGRLSPQAARSLQDPSQPVPFFVGVALSFGLILAGFWAWARLVQGKRFSDQTGPWRWSLVARGFCVWLAILAAGGVLDFLLRPAGFTWNADATTPVFIAVAVPALAVQTFTEEFVFRGFLTQALVRAFKRPATACLVSGLVFGAVHIPNGWVQALTAALFGVVLAMLTVETGSIALGWGLHLANNLFAAVALVSAGDVFHGARGLIRQDTPQLTWIDFAFTLAALAVAVRFLPALAAWPRGQALSAARAECSPPTDP